jgi:hypothetical protein
MKNENGRSGVRVLPNNANPDRWPGARLRLVVSRESSRIGAPASARVRLRAVTVGTTGAIALPSGTYDLRFTSTRRPGATKDDAQPGHEHEGLRPEEGIIMKAFEQFIRSAGRFAVGFGSGLALVCAFVIVTTDLGDQPKVVRPADIVHLDPVVVTISADRFAELQAQIHGVPVLVRTLEHGLTEG